MIDEAQYTIMGFIKGPVCRGQIALDVIEDQFWVWFIDPDVEAATNDGEFLATQLTDLQLPASEGSDDSAAAALAALLEAREEVSGRTRRRMSLRRIRTAAS